MKRGLKLTEWYRDVSKVESRNTCPDEEGTETRTPLNTASKSDSRNTCPDEEGTETRRTVELNEKGRQSKHMPR